MPAPVNIKKYISVMSLLFFISILLGYSFALHNKELASKLTNEISSSLNFVKKLSPFYIFLFIFLNNAIKSLVVILLGFFFGIAPLIFIFSNGYILGIVVAITSLKAGWSQVILGLVPHGILEVPAVIIASGYGFWLGVKFYRKLKYKEPFKNAFIYSMKKFCKVILPLLLVAAIIETFFTPHILKKF